MLFWILFYQGLDFLHEGFLPSTSRNQSSGQDIANLSVFVFDVKPSEALLALATLDAKLRTTLDATLDAPHHGLDLFQKGFLLEHSCTHHMYRYGVVRTWLIKQQRRRLQA